MKTFKITVPVMANGDFVYTVKARSKGEAVDKYYGMLMDDDCKHKDVKFKGIKDYYSVAEKEDIDEDDVEVMK